CEDPVRRERLDLAQRRRMVERTDCVLLRVDDLHVPALRRLLHFLRDGQRKQVVPRENRDPLNSGRLLLHQVGERLRQRLVGREGAEQKLVALIVNLLGRRGRGDRRDLVLLRHAGSCLGRSRSHGREKEVDLVLGNQLLRGLYRARGIGLVVDRQDLDLHSLVADLDSTCLVRRFYPKIDAVLQLRRFRRERTRDRQRRTNPNRVLCLRNVPEGSPPRKREGGQRREGKSILEHAYLLILWILPG